MAVAYEHGFYIGQVTSVESKQAAMVQFLNQGYKDVLLCTPWPRVEDIAEIEAKFVFASEFEVLSSNNGRTWAVPELNHLNDLYQEYKDCYF